MTIRRSIIIVIAAVATGIFTGQPVYSESISPQDWEEIARLSAAKGLSADDIGVLIEQVNKAGERGVPPEPLANKIKEGLAKGIDPQRIEPVVRRMAGHFESAQEVLKEAGARGVADVAAGSRQRALEALAEAFARGATAEEVREIGRLTQEGRQKVAQEAFASGAKSFAVLKEAGVSAKDGSALVGEALRQGFRSNELVDLAREIKRRGRDFQEGRASVQAIREQISRGDRGDRLFRDSDRSGSGGGDRMERSGGSDRGDRVREDRSGRGDRPERIERQERTDRSERSHGGRDSR